MNKHDECVKNIILKDLEFISAKEVTFLENIGNGL